MNWYDSDSDYETGLGNRGRANDSDEDDEPTLARQIRSAGPRNYLTALNRERYANIDRQNAEAEIYGQQNIGPYSMENFIVDVLELDMTSENARRAIQWEEAGEYIIDKAVQAININPNKKEIQFTPQDKSEYDKIKSIYDKLALDLNKMICSRLKLSPCPSNSKLIQVAQEMYPDIRFEDGMTFGYKLKVIEDYLLAKTKAEAKGGKKTRRRRSISKRRIITKKRIGTKRRIRKGKSKRI
jgi:hypothetical protein